jgi:hypothetical protein
MCTLQGETRSTHHTVSTLDLQRVPDPTSHVVHMGNLSLVPMRMKQAPTHGRSLGNWRQTDPIVILGHLIPPPSRQPWSRGERFRASDYTATLVYWAHITSIQYLLTGTNPSVLNRHRWGLPHRNHKITALLSPPFPSEGSTGPPNWPRLISILSDINHRFQGSSLKGLVAATWSSNHSAIYRNLYLHLAITNDLSLAIGSSRIDRKVTLMHLDINSTPINLMHNQES